MQSRILLSVLILWALLGCKSHGLLSSDPSEGLPPSAESKAIVIVMIPDLKNSEEECYFIDDFLPTPSQMVTGKNKDGLDLRYYTYDTANYKTWKDKKILLSFHSTSNPKCWALFEEQVVE